MSNIYLKVTIEENWRSQNFIFQSDSNEIRTHNHLVRKRTLNHLAKLVNWLSCVVNTYLYGACDCMLLSHATYEFQSEFDFLSLKRLSSG